MTEDRDLQKKLDFILELDKLKEVYRQTYLADGKRKENDAEHSWHLALMAHLLKDYAKEEVNVEKVMLMTLLHDVVEIDAGDTYAYDEEGYKTKEIREKAAADRIYGILPKEDGDYYYGLWLEFENMSTPDARFANVLDRLQPLMLNDATGGKSWEGHDVSYEKIYARLEAVKEGSPLLWEKAVSILEKNKKNLKNHLTNV